MTEARTITLPSGKVATIRAPKGRDTIRAQRVADPAKNQVEFVHALIAQVTTIDGKPVTAEDVAEMYQFDINALAQAVGDEKSFLDPARSSSLSSADSGTRN